MSSFFVKILLKIISIVILFYIILTFQFFLFRLALPDPTTIFLREGLSPEDRELIKKMFGLDQPLHIQYISYIVNFFKGDMGISFLYKVPVSTIVFDRLLNTAIILVPAIITAFIIAWKLGSYIAWHRGKFVEKISVVWIMIIHSAPLFWLGMIALLFFSVQLQIFPIGGMRTPPYQAENFLEKILHIDFLYHWILPYTILTIYFLSTPTLIMRTAMITTLGEDFINVLEAIGHPKKKIIRDTARYSILPLLTQGGITIGLAFGGSIAFETVFSWPGIGREILIAFNNLDYPLAQGIFAVLSLAVIISNTTVDMLYSYLDPRIRRG